MRCDGPQARRAVAKQCMGGMFLERCSIIFACESDLTFGKPSSSDVAQSCCFPTHHASTCNCTPLPCRAGDIYVHADLHGASTTLIKNHRPGQPVPPLTLAQVCWVLGGATAATGVVSSASHVGSCSVGSVWAGLYEFYWPGIPRKGSNASWVLHQEPLPALVAPPAPLCCRRGRRACAAVRPGTPRW